MQSDYLILLIRLSSNTDNHSVDSFNQIKINLKDGKAYEYKVKDSILGKVNSKLRNKLLTSLN